MEHANATLLVVDDDGMNRDALSRRLTRAGYTVLTAENGTDAIDMVNGNRVDAVLLDVMMPGISGIETLRRLRLTRSQSDLPVIMVTANDGSDDVVRALDLGANDYVTKPVDFPVALARIRTQVTARRADPLTGLPNKLQFMDRLGRSLAQLQATPFAVFFLDIDRFKTINDTLGHLAGDELLVGLARRLESSLRTTDTVARIEGDHTIARLGGDEFTILLNGVRGPTDARAVADRLLASIAEPFQVQGRDVSTSISIGIVLSDERYQEAEDMVRDADAAMYRAKSRGKARSEIFDVSMLAELERQRQLAADLGHVLAREELRVYYQPIVLLATGQLSGFEALLRWQHPDRGMVMPDEFIPTAEDTGLIVPIGKWVLEEACRQMTAWHREFDECRSLVINVNLSAKQCMQPALVDEVRQVLESTGLPAHCLKLEITEGAVLEKSETVVNVLNELRELGVKLGLDDFGMGYSALSYLQRFPFHTIKIDRSFVSGLEEAGNTEIVKAILSLAEGLAMDVTAEGVETPEQLSQLKDMSCEYGQGFYFYKPLARDEAQKVLSARNCREMVPVPDHD